MRMFKDGAGNKWCWEVLRGGKRAMMRDQVAVTIVGVRWAARPPQGSAHWREDSLPGLKEEESFQHGQGSVWTSWTIQYLLSVMTVVGGRHALWGRPSSKLPAPVYSPLPGAGSEKRVRNILCVRRDLYVSGTRLFLFSCSTLRTLFLWQKKAMRKGQLIH